MTSVGSGTWRAIGAHGRALAAAGATDAGTQREVNEDRFFVDAARGLFAVIDGVGGQAAGGRAADVALSIVRDRLARNTGRVEDRIREAILAANNEINRLASTRAEWQGMACVLTVAVVNNGTVTIGHVGDTRLYKLRDSAIEKITRDHSPVGEREDAGELTELQAMRHPRRNEVYRDVGSERHDPADADFIDLETFAFEPDAALLLCTDGLTDLVDSASIARLVVARAGDPETVVASLIDAANVAGGKDNVTVVYVEGEHFAPRDERPTAPLPVAARRAPAPPNGASAPVMNARAGRPSRRPLISLALLALLATATAGALWRAGIEVPWRPSAWFDDAQPVAAPAVRPTVQIVSPGGSIADAIANAAPDSEIVVEPGEYREQLVLKDRVRLVSRVPRGAILRLPATVPDSAAVPAVVANGLTKAELVGFRIVGDAATPLSVGIGVDSSTVSLVDVEISGATRAAVEFSGAGDASLVGSEVRDNPGAALLVHERASPRIAHNVFARNGTSDRAPGPMVLLGGAAPRFTGNVFVGLRPEAFAALQPAARATIPNENWFVSVSPRRTNRGAVPTRPQRNR